MAIAWNKPKHKLIQKMIDSDNAERIGQWIFWNALAKSQPHKFKVKRIGMDFALFIKFNKMWLTCQYSEPIKRPKPNLVLVQDQSRQPQI